MIHINLLPFRAARKKENIRFQISVYILSVILTAIGLMYYNNYLTSRIEQLNQDITTTQQQIDEYNKIAKQVEKLKNELAVLKQKLETITNLAKSRDESFKLVESLSALVIEKRMWLTTFEAVEQVTVIQNPDKTREEKIVVEIKINGIALDNKTVADFMTRLQESPLFVNVKLNSVRHETYKAKADIDMKSFFITCQKKTAESKETEVKPS